MHIVFDDFSPLIKDNETLKTVPDLYLNLSIYLNLSNLDSRGPKKPRRLRKSQCESSELKRQPMLYLKNPVTRKAQKEEDRKFKD